MTDTEKNDKFNRADALEDEVGTGESKFTCCVKPYTPYLDEAASENVRNFKYRGADQGFFYDLFWSPFAKYLTDRLPDWVNANAVSESLFSSLLICLVLYSLPLLDLSSFYCHFLHCL